MKANTKRVKIQKTTNCYNALRDQAFIDASQEIMQHSIAILLYSMQLNGSTDEELIEIFDRFVDMLNHPGVFEQKMRSDQCVEIMQKRLGIDFNRIQPIVHEDILKLTEPKLNECDAEKIINDIYNPDENIKDDYVLTFEQLMKQNHTFNTNDEKLRSEIRNRLQQSNVSHIGSDT